MSLSTPRWWYVRSGAPAPMDADIKLAAEYTLWSAMANAGQSCIGAERVYVVESVADEFIEEITKMAKKIEVGKDYGPATMP